MANVGDWSEKKRDNNGNKVSPPSPPPILILAWQCEKYGALPCAGGVLDQPYGLLEKLSEVHAIWHAMKAHRDAESEAEFALKFSREYDIVKKIRKLRNNVNSKS